MTLAQVRSKTERIREFSALPFLLVVASGVTLGQQWWRRGTPGVLPAPVPVPWIPGATHLDGGSRPGPRIPGPDGSSAGQDFTNGEFCTPSAPRSTTPPGGRSRPGGLDHGS